MQAIFIDKAACETEKKNHMMNFSILSPPGIAFMDCKEHCSVNHIQPIPSLAFLQNTKCPDERILG